MYVDIDNNKPFRKARTVCCSSPPVERSGEVLIRNLSRQPTIQLLIQAWLCLYLLTFGEEGRVYKKATLKSAWLIS
jgi:hypothetical protein